MRKLVAVAFATAAWAQQPGTLTLRAPQAESVTLRLADRGPGVPNPTLVKGENGVWTAPIASLPPGAYRYLFNVNGVPVVDPRNPDVSLSNSSVWSLLYVPGAAFMDTKDVPHGAVAVVTYHSNTLSKFRRMHVYTPPGYEAGSAKYPVLYLLHGSSDSDDAWTSVGRAGFILDNLIAARKAKPMIVVMPAGHTSLAGNEGKDHEFEDDFSGDIMPFVEKNYRTLPDRRHRAVAGLSMGGAQSLNIAFAHLDRFAYVGVFSAGVLYQPIPAWESEHAAMLDNASLKKGLKLLSLRTGSDDRLLTDSKAAVALLKKHGFDAVLTESTGAHSWINWRNYLNEFVPRLFQ